MVPPVLYFFFRFIIFVRIAGFQIFVVTAVFVYYSLFCSSSFFFCQIICGLLCIRYSFVCYSLICCRLICCCLICYRFIRCRLICCRLICCSLVYNCLIRNSFVYFYLLLLCCPFFCKYVKRILVIFCLLRIILFLFGCFYYRLVSAYCFQNG